MFLLPLLVMLIGCQGVETDKYNQYIYDSATVYGPYKVVHLPITKGVTVLNPIQISQGPGGQIFAANQSGEIYILKDSDNDGLEDEAALYCNISHDSLKSPAGFAFRGDTIYVGASQEIRAYLDQDKDGRADTSWTFFNDIPQSEHPYEWTSGLCFGPDGFLYCALTTDSWNAGASPDPKGYRGALLRIAPNGHTAERLATGIRSVYGMAFNPHGDLFFADNEGGGNNKEELNRFIAGRFYGHNPKKYADRDTTLPAEGPALALETEMAPSGIEFNGAGNDFGGTAGDLFIAFYGPGERWNRGAVGRVKITRQGDGSYRYEEHPVVDIPKLSDLCFGQDGSLYVAHHGKSDYWYNPTEEKTGGFYKVIYDPSVKGWQTKKKKEATGDLSADAIEAGRQLFARRACAACHATDNGTELLGPNLNGISGRLSREEILEEVMDPNKRIKPSMVGMKVVKNDGQILLGRVVNADEKQVSLMLIGNAVVQISRSDIASAENHPKSLMYEKLLNGMSKEEVDHLLDYIMSLQ